MAFLMAMLPVKLMGTSPKAKEDVTKTYLMLENLQELVAKKSLSAFIHAPPESPIVSAQFIAM